IRRVVSAAQPGTVPPTLAHAAHPAAAVRAPWGSPSPFIAATPQIAAQARALAQQSASPAAPDGWAPPVRTSEARPTSLSRSDIEHLPDKVMTAIDKRLNAQRERQGRRT